MFSFFGKERVTALRIISGSRRGHKLLEFEGMDIRPTTDRVRESMFNLIADYVYEAKVLDLFGGSGALSFEALSRGAVSSVICDTDRRSLKLIEENARKLRFENDITVKNISAQDFIKLQDTEFDLIFLDPPYNKGFIGPVIEAIVSKNILSDEGIIVLESDHIDEHGEFSGLDIIKQKRYGRTYITVYQRGDSK